MHELTNGAGVDVIIDLVGGAYFPFNLEALAERGRLICVSTAAGRKSEIDLGLVLRKRATIVGTVLRARTIEEKAEAVSRFCRPRPSVGFAWCRPADYRPGLSPREIRAAHEHLESNRSVGKVVLDFSV